MMAETTDAEETTEEETDDGPRRREPALRVFAAEFNDAHHETRGEGERAPSYVITPLGARVNRLLAVGVLTSNEPTGDDGNMRRAQLTDPTGVFHVYAGQYQPEALETLESLDPPAIVAVVGKARTYSPEEGTVYTSIRPETIHPVDSEDRDAWILEAAEHTVDRVEALDKAYGVEDVLNEDTLAGAGVPEERVEGILEAMEAYGQVDLGSYLSLVSDALGYLLPDPPEPEIVHAGEGEPEAEPATGDDEPEPPQTPAPGASPGAAEADADATPEPTAQTEPAADAEDAPEGEEPGHPDPEGLVFDLVEELDDGDGAAWEKIVEEAQDAGLAEEQVEEAMNVLMDRGRVFEPVLGKLKPT
jgi:RPA family protein